MKCDEIGRLRWFIDDQRCKSGGQWCWMSLVMLRRYTLDRMEVNQVRRLCDQMLMWDSGYWGVEVPAYEDCPWRVSLCSDMKCEGEWRWDCWGGRFLFEQYGKLWRWWGWRNICRGGKNKIIKNIIFFWYVCWMWWKNFGEF